MVPHVCRRTTEDEARAYLDLEPWEGIPEDDGLMVSEMPSEVFCAVCRSQYEALPPEGWEGD